MDVAAQEMAIPVPDITPANTLVFKITILTNEEANKLACHWQETQPEQNNNFKSAAVRDE